MSAETGLLWPGVALLLLLGVVASLCARCSRPGKGVKRSERIFERRSMPSLRIVPCVSRQETQRNFAVGRTYSLAGQAWPGPLMDTASDVAAARKDKLLRFSPSLEDSASSRYQNFSKRSRHGSDAAYINPITTDYYNWEKFQKPQEDDDDANSYENVLICKQKQPDSGDEDSEDYQNSASIQQWRESVRVVGQVPKEAPPPPAGSPEEDDSEPDYVNEDVAAREA
ncbi:linker for activation of T-cells family member 2 isoform X2 [Saccopteryx bilineata]|uniref:linker for activation of T-cells family member 2 isoform X2 n=1 Tax=Saccopteryx bilineata TaxID=59482 RepID=UPI00338F1288